MRLVHSLEQSCDRFGSSEIKTAGRLIRQQNLRRPGQCSSEPDALLFSSRKLSRQMRGAPLKADLPEATEGKVLSFVFCHTPDQKGHRDIFERRKFRQQGWILPYEPNFGISKLGQLTLTELSEVARSITDAALIGTLQTTQEMKQRRLPNP